jgi:hypothetical protein
MERRHTGTRRALLRTAGLVGVAGLAGCTGVGDGPAEGPTDGPADSPTETPTGTPNDGERPTDATHRITVTGTDAPPDLAVEPSVSVVDPYATGTSPPVVRVDVANPTADPVSIGEYRAVVFQYVHSDDETLVWLPHSERSTEGEPARTRPDYPVAGDGCWRLTDAIAVTMEYGVVEIPAGGTLTAFVGLYGGVEADACLAPGKHRFETTYTVSPISVGEATPTGTATDTEPATATDDRPQATWGFSLDVEAL